MGRGRIAVQLVCTWTGFDSAKQEICFLLILSQNCAIVLWMTTSTVG